VSQDDSWIDDLASGPEAHTLKQGFAYLRNEVERLTQENARLRAAEVAWRERCIAQDQLLICYRIDRFPSERLHRELERTRQAIHALEEQ